MPHFLAVDLGAESGRAMLATLERRPPRSSKNCTAFPTPVRLPDRPVLGQLRLFHEILHGLAIAGRERKLEIAGIGIDTWGVDFGLLGGDGALVDCPAPLPRSAHRRHDGEAVRSRAARRGLRHTGIQFMQLNTLYQLYAMKLAGSPALGRRRTPAVHARTCSTTGSPAWRATKSPSPAPRSSTIRARKHWATELFERLGLPTSILPPTGRRRARCSARCCRTSPRLPARPGPGLRHRRPRHRLRGRRRSRRRRQTGATSAPAPGP